MQRNEKYAARYLSFSREIYLGFVFIMSFCILNVLMQMLVFCTWHWLMSNVLIALLVYLSGEKRFAIILQELDFKITMLSQIHFSYAYVYIKINCVKASLRYVYMSLSQALFRQQLSSNLDSCLFPSNHKASHWKSSYIPTQRANQWILTLLFFIVTVSFTW